MLKLVIIDEEILIDKNLKLNPVAKEILKQYTENGIKVAVVTHRSFYEVKNTFSGLINLLLFICDDGAAVFGENTVYYMGVIDRRALSAFIKIAECEKDMDMYLSLKAGVVKVKGENAKKLSEITEEVSKISLYSKNSGAALLNITPNLHKNNLRISYYDESVTEITDINSSREEALKLIERRFGIFNNETMCFLKNEHSAPLCNYTGAVITEVNGPFALKEKSNKESKDLIKELALFLKHYVNKGQN